MSWAVGFSFLIKDVISYPLFEITYAEFDLLFIALHFSVH